MEARPDTSDRLSRVALALLHLAVALTAAISGLVIVLDAIWPESIGGFGMPLDYLDGSPFDSYLIPGLALGLVLGGSHVLAFIGQVRRLSRAPFLSAVAAFAMLIWIFVQMMYIPFSFLQAVYFTVGLAEVGFVMLGLGVLRPRALAPTLE